MFFSNTSSYACSYRQWHYLGAPIWKNRQFPGWWRDGDANSLQYLAAVPKALAADTKLFPVFLDGDFLHSFEVLFYVRPFDAAMPGGFEPPVDLFSGPTQESYRKHDHEWFHRADEKPALAWLQNRFHVDGDASAPHLNKPEMDGAKRVAAAAADALANIDAALLLPESGLTARNALFRFSVKTGSLVFENHILDTRGRAKKPENLPAP